MSKKLNTLHLSSLDLWPMGENKGRVSLTLPLEAYVKRGHNVVYLTDVESQKKGNIKGINIKKVWSLIRPVNKRRWDTITRFLIMPFASFNFFLAGLKTSFKNKPDVIYSHTKATALPAYLLSKLFKAKYVLRLYGIGAVENSSFIAKIKRVDLYFAMKIKADLYIITNDGTNGDIYALKHGVPKQKIHFLKNGIDKSWASKKSNLTFKNQLVKSNEKILLSVSRLTGSKQIDLIINAMPQIIERDERVKLLIVGDGIDMPILKNLVADLKVENNIIFTGAKKQNEIIDYMNAADIFISMNALSSMSNPVFEAMICGKPVIALNKGDTTQIVRNNITGVLVEPNNIAALPEIIIELLSKPDKMLKMGRNAQKMILEEWPTWDERVNYEINLIEEIYARN